jgi:putative DNA primase/helicase
VAGCYFLIGEPVEVLCVAEGYATAASIHEATGNAVAVAFNAGNLVPAARALRARYPNSRIIICADDDAKTEGNPGLTKAHEAAQAVGGLFARPDFGGNRPERATDFNDLHRHAGSEVVRACIEAAAFCADPDNIASIGEWDLGDDTGPIPRMAAGEYLLPQVRV